MIELPDAQASRAGSALDKIRQAAKAGRSGRYREAAALYEEALRLLPQHTEARRELAMVQMELGQPAAAKQNLIRVLQLDPRDAWAYLILGNLYYKHEHDGGSAERYFATAADLAPDDSYVLNSYGGLLAERGRYAEAQEMFERAIAASPTIPIPISAWPWSPASRATKTPPWPRSNGSLPSPSGDTGGADARSEPVYAEARRSYATLRARRAERLAGAAAAELQAALDAYSARTGIAIRVQADPALKSDAKTELAWRYGRPYHVILHAREGANSHLVAHEFAHILLDEALRAEGVNKLFADNEETRRRALGAVDKDVRKIQVRRKLPAGEMARLVDGMLQSLTSQLFNTPLDLFIERRIFGEFPGLRDAQFVDLARQMADNARIAAEPQARELIPQRLLQANLAMGAAFALFVDDLFGGATAYAAAYQATGMLPTGRKLYTLFQAAAAGGQPGAEYALVDAWADELRLRDWYAWRADTAVPDPSAPAAAFTPDEVAAAGHRTAQQTIAMHEGGPTNPDYLADPAVQMAATMHMLAALRRYSALAPDQIQAIALEIAVLGMNGINYIAGEQQYTLKTLPGEQFSGLELLCLQYVGFQLVRPEIDTKIPLGAAYREAKAMFDAGS